MNIFILGALFGGLGIFAYRYLPAKWLCDYNETPQSKHLSSARKLPLWAWALCVLINGFVTLGICTQIYTDTWCIPVVAVLVSVLQICAIADIQYQILPDEGLLVAGMLGIVLLLSEQSAILHTTWYWALLAGLIGFFAVWLVLLIAAKIYRTQAMGFGDVKLAGVAGILCGLQGLAMCFLVAIISAALLFAVLLLCKKITAKSMVAFGPFIIIGIFFTLALWQPWHNVLAWYLSLFL